MERNQICIVETVETTLANMEITKQDIFDYLKENLSISTRMRSYSDEKRVTIFISLLNPETNEMELITEDFISLPE